MRRQRGVALILVLTMLSILIGISANYMLSISRETESIDIVNSRTQARYSAFAGVQYAQFAMQDGDKALRWTTDGRLFSTEFAGGVVYLRILPASGRIDINRAGVQLLTLLFEYAGFSEEQAEQVAANVVHWRGQSGALVAGAVSDEDYEDAGLAVPPHRAFYTVEELVQVLGMDLVRYNKIKSLVTVYGSARVNALAASDEVLKMLILSDENIAAIRTAHMNYITDDTPFPKELQVLSPFLTFKIRDNYYRVLSYAVAGNGTSEAVYSLIKSRRDKNGAFQTMQTGLLNAVERAEFIQMIEQEKAQEG